MLFKLENNILVIDRDEVRGFKEFRRILERDKGSDGDADGRKKYRAFKEFYYIYYIADYRSTGNLSGDNEKNLHLQGVKYAELEEGFKPDADIKEAIRLYKEIQELEAPSNTLVLKLIKGVKLSEQVVANMILGIEKVLEMNQKELMENEIPNIAAILGNNTALETQLKSLTSLAIAFPKTLTTLEETRAKLYKEEANNRKARGGREIGNRADPTKA